MLDSQEQKIFGDLLTAFDFLVDRTHETAEGGGICTKVEEGTWLPTFTRRREAARRYLEALDVTRGVEMARCQRVNLLGWRCRIRALKGRLFCALHEHWSSVGSTPKRKS